MDIEPIFSAEQIQVHPDLAKTIKEYTKAVIKSNPENIVDFSYTYFKEKVDAKAAKSGISGAADATASSGETKA